MKIENADGSELMLFPGTIQGNEINCSVERNVPMAKDISQMIDREEGWERLSHLSISPLIFDLSWKS